MTAPSRYGVNLLDWVKRADADIKDLQLFMETGEVPEGGSGTDLINTVTSNTDRITALEASMGVIAARLSAIVGE